MAKPEAAHFTVPPGAEAYAITLDPSGLSSRDYEVVREFLLRANSLERRRRYVMSANLARALAVKLGHNPPAGISPELFLVCLAARYQAGQQPGHATAREPVTPPASPVQDFSTPESVQGATAPAEAWRDFAPPQ